MTVVDLVRPASTEPNRAMIVFFTMTATLMQILDTTIANVALPHMEGSLGATPDQVAWVLTSYIVAAAIATPVTGWIASRFGRTRYFVVILIGFTVASALCGLAVTLPQIVLFRILQGAFGAAIVPLSQAILLDAFPRSMSAKAMGIFSIGVMLGPILGPTIGGYLTDEYSWRWCFYINVPIGIATVIGILAFVPETTRTPGRKLDWFGFGFLSLGVASLQLFLDRGEQQGWLQSSEILIEITLAVFAFYMFAVHSMTTAKPFFDPRLFRDRTYVISIIIMAAIFVVYYGSMALTPQMLQTEFNYPVLTSGLVMAPRGVSTIIAILIVGRLNNLVGSRVLIAFGLVIAGMSMYMTASWSQAVSPMDIIIAGLLQGAGNGFINVPLSTMAFATLPTDLRTEGSGLYNLMRNIGSAIGVSVAASQLTELTQINHGYLAEFMTPFRHLPSMPNMSGAAAIRMLNLSITQQAGMVAYVNVFWLLGGLCIAIIPLALLLRPPPKIPAASQLASAE